jgi:hypothetical protein
MGISLTLFNSIFDNKTDKNMQFSDWQQFENLLYQLSKVERKDKKDAQLISPATYQPNTTRANANVVNWSGWAAVDVDDHVFEGNLENELFDRYGNWYYVCYSTASSTIDHPKFRIVFPLKTEVETSFIKKFWYALNTELGSIGDRQTKDLSRMYYIPATYAGANNFIFTNSAGQFIDPYALIDKHPLPEKQGATFFERLPESMQKMIIQHRKDQMQNNQIQWTSYLDCPFVNKNLIAEYKAISGTGWYHMMYRIMVSIAGNAVKREYPITVHEVVQLCKELDMETGNWYDNRPLDKEAERAIEFVYSNM